MLTFSRGSGPDGDWVDNHFDCYFGSMMSDDSEKGSQPADNPNGIKRTSAEFRQTVVMITHNDDIARLADRIVRIEDGKIVE